MEKPIEKLKIVILALFNPRRNDAVKVHTLEIAEHLAKKGNPVELVTPAGKLDLHHARQTEFNCTYRDDLFPLIRCSVSQLLEFVRTRGFGAEVAYFRWRLFPLGIFRLAGWILGLKMQFTSEHNGWVELEMNLQKRNPVLAKFAGWLQYRDAKAADAVIVVTEGIRQLLIRKGVSGDKITVIGNGTNTEYFRPLADKTALKNELLGHNRTVLGFSGNFAGWQGIEEIIRVFARLSAEIENLHLLLIGDGPLLGQLKYLITQLNLTDRVSLKQNIPYDHMLNWMNVMDLALAPKSPELEVVGYSPLKIRDYAACGIPVVSTDVSGIRELAGEGWLWTYPPGEANAMYTCLNEILSNPKRLQQAGQRARAYAEEHFSWEHVTKQIRLVMRHLVHVVLDDTAD